jgi:hypothetical protein
MTTVANPGADCAEDVENLKSELRALRLEQRYPLEENFDSSTRVSFNCEEEGSDEERMRETRMKKSPNPKTEAETESKTYEDGDDEEC